MTLNIPSRLHDIAADLLSRDATVMQQIVDAIKPVEPGSSIAVYETAMAEQFSDETAEWHSEVLSLVFSLTSLNDLDISADNTVADFMNALNEIDDERIEKATPEQRTLLKSFLSDVLANQDRIGLGAKAYRLNLQHERVYVYSEVYSDVRHIFSTKGASDKPIAGLVYHSLKIHTHGTDGNFKDVYIAMDYQDLIKLKRAIDRAIEKHETLSSLVQEMGIRYVEPGGES